MYRRGAAKGATMSDDRDSSSESSQAAELKIVLTPKNGMEVSGRMPASHSPEFLQLATVLSVTIGPSLTIWVGGGAAVPTWGLLAISGLQVCASLASGSGLALRITQRFGTVSATGRESESIAIENQSQGPGLIVKKGGVESSGGEQ
jgi:hypothetical protein